MVVDGTLVGDPEQAIRMEQPTEVGGSVHAVFIDDTCVPIPGIMKGKTKKDDDTQEAKENPHK